jgi:hypothetical protein
MNLDVRDPRREKCVPMLMLKVIAEKIEIIAKQ